MLYYFFAMLIAAGILLANNYRNEMNRWASFFLGSAAIGGLTDLLTDSGLNGWSQAVQVINHTFTPYGVLVFSLIYSERFPRSEVRRRFKLLLFIPVALMLLVSFLSAEIIHYRLLLVWVIPYYLAACWLLLIALWSEPDRRKKRSRFIAAVIIVPTLLAVMVLINIGNAISPNYNYFPYVSLFFVYSLTVALLCTFIYGVLGVRLRFEHDPLESTMKVVSSGAALLNHTIKNEVGKIAISSENLKLSMCVPDEAALQHLQIIERAADHMLAMAVRIHSQMKDIVLNEQQCRLDELIDQCVMQHQRTARQGIRITTAYSCRPIMRIDAVHLQEAIGNLLANAKESLPPEGGEIAIGLSLDKRGIRLSIQDNGSGIPADQLARVVEPFYSTKQQAGNFGLGLAYVHNVLQKSGGSVNISSKEGAGTLVELHLPGKKLIDPNGRNHDGTD